METCISKEEFESLQEGDALYGRNKMFKIVNANCGGPGKHPTHFISVEINGGEEGRHIFHDGEKIRYLSEDRKEMNGAIVGDLASCTIIRLKTRIKNRARRAGILNISGGNYCPDCGGLCGNSNHTGRKW